jgi:hypothetical protein
MAFTTVPTYFQDYALNEIGFLNNVQTQGLIEFFTKSTRGDQFWTYPKLASLDTSITADTVVTTSSDLTTTALNDYSERMPVLHRHAGVYINDISELDKGIEPWKMLAPQLPGTIWKTIQTAVGAMFTGLFTTSGTLVATHQSDKSSIALTSNHIFSEPVSLLGEVGLTFNKVMMHSLKAIDLKEDIESKVTTLQSGDTVLTQYLGNKQVIINDTICAPTSDVYPTYIFTGSPVKMGWEKDIRIEEDRAALTSKTHYIGRWDYALGFKGVNYGGAANPANTVIDDAASWTRVGPVTDIRLIQIKSL